jgi:cytochrome d ubiquinol oxidase subunit II
VVAALFFDLFPRVMISSTNAAYNLTVANSASNSYSLKVMTVIAAIFFPLVLLYQGWSLYTFRKRLGAGPSTETPAEGDPEMSPAPEHPEPSAAGT